MLCYPVFTLPIQIYTDASNSAIGVILSQVRDGSERVNAYASKTLSKTERNASLRPYLGWTDFEIYTDHKPLSYIKDLKPGNDPTGRRERWLIELSVYSYSIIHRPGSSHANADVLSRIHIGHVETVANKIPDTVGLAPCSRYSDGE